MRCKAVLLNMAMVAVMLICFTFFAFAEDVTSNSLYEKYNIELSEDVIEVLEAIGFSEFTAEEISNVSVADTFRSVFEIFKGSLKEPFLSLCALFGIILLCTLGNGFVNNNNGLKQYFDSVSTLFVALYAFTGAINSIGAAVDAMYAGGILMKSLIPTVAVLAAFSGSPSAAVSYNAVSMYFAQFIAAVCRDFLSPVMCAFAAVSVCTAMNSVFNVDTVLSAVKRFVNVLLGLMGAIYTGILALKDVLAVGIDKVAVKGVKFVIGSAVPVVGSALSEGLSSVIASVSLMKNTYGTIGIIVIVAVTLPAVCELILWSCTFMLSGYAAQALGLSSVSRILECLKYVISMMLSILLFTVYMLIVSSAMIILLGGK